MTEEEKVREFEDFYNEYQNLVWWHLHNKVVATREDKEDIFQKIWMGVWEHIDTTPKDKRHAFLYRVIENQIKKFFYYRKRDRHLTMEQEETSEGKEYNILDITKELDAADDYSYFELLDTIESTLTDEELDLFIYYYEGIARLQIQKKYHMDYFTLKKKYEVIKEKLSEAFGQPVTLPLTRIHKKSKN